jgi:hypothetical protein
VLTPAPTRGGLVEDTLEGPPVAADIAPSEGVRDDGDVVELVPALVELRRDRPATALDHGGRGVSLSSHRAVHDGVRRDALAGQRPAQHPALLDPGLAEYVVVVRTERRLPVPDQQHDPHQASTTRRVRCSR